MLQRLCLARWFVCCLMTSLLLSGGVVSAQDLAVANPGFEAGEEGWTFRDNVSHVVPEAAHQGKQGLKITLDPDASGGSSVMSGAYAVSPGDAITLRFYGKATKKCLGVYVIFKNAKGKWLNDAVFKQGKAKAAVVVKATDHWTEHEIIGTAPDEAAWVSVWIHAFSGMEGEVMVDDIQLTGLSPEAKYQSARVSKRPAIQEKIDPTEVPQRQTPPIIVIKLDDLKPHKGGAPHHRWKKVADCLAKRNIPGSIGVIAGTLKDAPKGFTDWIKARHDETKLEFWFHGWDHKAHRVDGKVFNEFVNRPFEEQQRRFEASQALAHEQLGFYFQTFGPTGGQGRGLFDDATLKVLAEQEHIHVMLYPQPLDDAGRALEAKGQVLILDRVWAANLEGHVGTPDYQRFLKGYGQNLDRPYFVLQGHPTHWNDHKFANFEKILDFLVERQAVFMTPAALAKQLRQAPTP